jgi:hypothetical protein
MSSPRPLAGPINLGASPIVSPATHRHALYAPASEFCLTASSSISRLGPQGQGVRGVETMANTVQGGRRIALLESYGRR